MADFHGHQLTEAGRNLLAKILAGNKILAYTKMALGDGQLGSTPIPSLTAVISPKVTIKVDQTPVRNSVGRWNVTTVFSNKDLENPFYFREWGVFAQDPDTQQDVLVLYANSGQTADLIPVWDGSQESTLIEQQLTCSCIVDSQITVTALIDPSQVYVTEENFSAHKNDKNNPHEVDPYQIGAETPAGAQEKADAAKAAAIAVSDPKGSAAAVSSGVTGGTIKAAKAAAADTAAKLTTKRTIALSGAVTGTATGFDGSANITIPVTYVNAAPKENFIQNGHFYAGGLYNPSGKTEFRSPETQGPYGWNVELPTGSEGIYIVNKGIALKPGTATSVGIVQPYNDYTKSLIGEVCTVSLVDGDGNLNEAQVNIGDERGGKTIGKFRLFSTSSNFLYIRLYKENSQNETITSVKAEFGSQTLAKEVSGGKWQLIDTPNKYATLWGGLTPFVCTEAQYAALVDKNPNTLYFIVG